MTAPLLATKLFIPPVGKNLVERPRLIKKLDECLNPSCRLTLIAAPAGFGKTTLVSAWVLNIKSSTTSPYLSVTWLGLDAGDNNPVLFWSYVINSLQTQHKDIGKQSQHLLQSGNSYDMQKELPLLINELAQISTPFILVLDDYHLIRNPDIHSSLSFFLEHSPSSFHVIILSRTDPPLSLALLRGRGQLLEIRMKDLRFSDEEATTYLKEEIGLSLSQNAVNALNTKTEGWAAGLQMAALSMQGVSDTTLFIQSFSGSNRFILDYLVEEVLKRQPEAIQDFLVRTSILEIFCNSLCNALIHETYQKDDYGSQLMLEYLENSNLFIVPLDDDRYWYRYHNLFADLLKKRLQLCLPGEIISLHHKASQWYEQNGLIKQAIEHSILAEDFDRAIFLINQAAEHFFGYGDRASMAQWIRAIPEEHLRKNLNLEVLRAASLSMDGHIREAETCIQNVEKWLEPIENPDAQQTILIGRIMTVHSNIASYRGDLDAILFYAPRALEKLSGDSDLTWRSWNLVNLSNLSVSKGDVDAAIHYLSEGIEAGKATRSPDMVLTTMFYHILMLWLKASIREASQASKAGLEYIAENHLDDLPRAGALIMMWGLILCERHELASAEQAIDQGYKLVKLEKSSPLWHEIANLIRLRFLIANADLISADRVVKEAILLYSENEIPEMLAAWIRGFITEFWILRGQFAEVEKDFQDHNIHIDGEVAYPYYGEYLSLARFLQAKGEQLSAINLLERIIHQAEIDKQFRWAVSGYVLLALAYQAQDDVTRAVTTLDKAFNLAESEGFSQIFIDEGEPMERLLTTANQTGFYPDFTHQILAAFPTSSISPRAVKQLQRHKQSTKEPLSGREIEVLRLIAGGYTNKEIAQKLRIALRTVKYHTTSIYTKLDVTGRAHAVAKGREMGLL
jgi:ATP/maltotriose-dependent transcriptional regulator MalT